MITVLDIRSMDLRHGELQSVWQNLEYLRFFEVVYIWSIYICVKLNSMWVYFMSNLMTDVTIHNMYILGSVSLFCPSNEMQIPY